MKIHTKSRRGAFLAFAAAILGTLGAAQAQNAPSIEVKRVPDGGIQPQIAVEGAKVHLLYYKGDPKAGDLYYARSDDGGQSFGAAVRVNSQAGSAIAMGTIRGGQLAVGRNGRVHVAWNGSGQAQPRVNEGSPMLYSRQMPNGQFEPERNLMNGGFALDGGGSLAADSAGHVYLAWHACPIKGGGEGRRLVYMTRSSDDGATFDKETPVWNEPTGVCGCCQLKVWAGEGNKVRVLYRAATNIENRDTYLVASDDGGRTFRGAKVHPWKIDSCPMSSYSFNKNADTLLVAWESDRKVYWAPTNDTATGAILAAPGTGDNRKYPVLAVNARGETLLAWSENTAWARGGKIKWQLYDAARRPLAAGEQPGMPVWSMPAVFTKPDGSFALLY